MLDRSSIGAFVGAISVCLFWGWQISTALQQSPKTIQEQPRTQINERAPNSRNYEPWLIVFRVFMPGGLKKISDYCNSYSEHEKKNWPQGYYCDLKITDVYIAVFTGFLALFTVGLIWVTGRLAKLTKRSADIAERALTELESPFIFVKLKSEEMLFQQGRVKGHLRFVFGNYGRTPAHILEFVDAHEVVGLGDGQPKVVDPSAQRGTVMPYGVIAPPQGVSQDFAHVMFDEMAGKVLFFFGYVRYADIFRKEYTLGFCYQFDPKRDRWVLSGGSKYNYWHPEDGSPVTPSWFSPSATSGNLRSVLAQAAIDQEDSKA